MFRLKTFMVPGWQGPTGRFAELQTAGGEEGEGDAGVPRLPAELSGTEIPPVPCGSGHLLGTRRFCAGRARRASSPSWCKCCVLLRDRGCPRGAPDPPGALPAAGKRLCARLLLVPVMTSPEVALAARGSLEPPPHPFPLQPLRPPPVQPARPELSPRGSPTGPASDTKHLSLRGGGDRTGQADSAQGGTDHGDAEGTAWGLLGPPPNRTGDPSQRPFVTGLVAPGQRGPPGSARGSRGAAAQPGGCARAAAVTAGFVR